MILKLDSRGEDVLLLQRRLTRAGYPVHESHIYDAETQAAVLALQQ